MYETFKDYYDAIRLSPEVFGKYSDREVYDFCARKWVERGKDPASIPSIEDSVR